MSTTSDNNNNVASLVDNVATTVTNHDDEDPQDGSSSSLLSTAAQQKPDPTLSVASASASASASTRVSINKENSPNGIMSPTVASTSRSTNAHSSSVDHEDSSFAKRPMTTTTTGVPATTTTSSYKKLKTEQDDEGKEGEILDLAVTLGYQPGDRLQVQWEIEQDNDEDDEETRPPPVVKWWGATLQEFDGRSEDSVAIRVLKYDPCPELGFDESSLEDVIFMGDSLLVSPDSSMQLNYKREGSDEDTIVWLNENDMDEQLNAILMGALAKNEAVWKALPPAQQAVIAENIKTKKEELLKVLRSKKEVITSATIKDILRETFGGSK